jgi:hypothetical protein
MIRNEIWRDGAVIEATIVDIDGGLWQREVDGQIVESRPLTADEINTLRVARTITEPITADEAITRLAKITLAPLVRADTLTPDQIVDLAPLFPQWAPGITVSPGEVYSWDGTLVEVIQAHMTQADWTPDRVPALFKIHRQAGTVAPWVQPAGAHDAYQIGDRVTHNGQAWESTAANNVWEPGVYGWVFV